MNLRERKKGGENMFQKESLVKALSEKKLTLKDFAQELGINEATLYRKMNGDSDFSRSEIQKAKDILCLTQKGTERIFFA